MLVRNMSSGRDNETLQENRGNREQILRRIVEKNQIGREAKPLRKTKIIDLTRSPKHPRKH